MKNDQATINITASGIAFASGSALVGEALLGSSGGFIGAILGLGVGVVSEILSPRSSEGSLESKKTKTS